MRGLKLWRRECCYGCYVSHLLQMRGLKHFSLDREHHRHKSHLLQMRGLKLFSCCSRHLRRESHLLQMRGLKQTGTYNKDEGCCRIFYRCVDWNPAALQRTPQLLCRIFYRCVDWNWSLTIWAAVLNAVASFTDAWIETGLFGSIGAGRRSHLLQMRGLKH